MCIRDRHIQSVPQWILTLHHILNQTVQKKSVYKFLQGRLTWHSDNLWKKLDSALADIKNLAHHRPSGNAKDKNESTPLYVAALIGQIDTVRLLIQDYPDININAEDEDSLTSLAAFEGHSDIVWFWIQHNPKLTATKRDGHATSFCCTEWWYWHSYTFDATLHWC